MSKVTLVAGKDFRMMTNDEALMEWIHLYRIDSAKHHIQGVWKAELDRFCSFEAAMFFTERGVVTINCELKEKQ